MKIQRSDLKIIGWIFIAALLQVWGLASKPVWADEWSSLAFGLGAGFREVPLNQVISAETLLSPVDAVTTWQGPAAFQSLQLESNHPPLYFQWLHLWLLVTGFMGSHLIWWGRLFSVLWGLATVAIAGFFGSAVGGWRLAVLLAVSPFGVYLGQEIRHYSLASFWVLCSLLCFVQALRNHKNQTLSWRVVVAWSLVNNLGIATHFFFGLGLVAQAVTLLSVAWQDWHKRNLNLLQSPFWQRIGIVAFASVLAGFWLPWAGVGETERLTTWLNAGNPWGDGFLGPPVRLLLWFLSMFVAFPIEGVPMWVAIVSGVFALGLVGWWACQEWGPAALDSETALIYQGLRDYLLFVILLLLLLIYGFDTDLSLAPRYQFVTYPAVMMLMGIFVSSRSKTRQGRTLFFSLIMAGVFGCLTVTSNFAFQKPDRPELVAAAIANAGGAQPVLIATLQKTHAETSKLMGVAWELQQRNAPGEYVYLLAHKNQTQGGAQKAVQVLEDVLAEQSNPFTLWFVNFTATTRGLQDKYGCDKDGDSIEKVSGYRFRRFDCRDYALSFLEDGSIQKPPL
ncbi:MAG: hypothetical protein AAGG02_02270 [Cyanobacteria bacterium P01_H01_bin.15]